MAHVYILYSQLKDRYYIGSTHDIRIRLLEHNSGMTPSTKDGRPWVCVFVHETQTLKKSRELEFRIKSWKDRKLIERIIQEGVLRIS